MYFAYLNIYFAYLAVSQIVGNKAKGRISKRVFQENKARQIFRKTNISYPLIRTDMQFLCSSNLGQNTKLRQFDYPPL